MSTTTTNLSLVKPANNENVDISVINDNYDKIDQFAGGVVDVTANPTGTATATLSKLTVGSTIYGIPVGSTVSATPIVSTGTKIATITIDGTGYDLYAPNSGDTVAWNQVQLTGTKIASISINGVSTDIYAPNSGGTTVIANPQGSATTDLNTVQIGNVIYAIPSGGGGGYEPTGESYTFMASGSTAQANIELDCSWTDGTTTEMRVIGDYTNLISGWGNRDYKNIRTNWDATNQCWKLISLSGDFECDGSYAEEGEVVATIASGNKVLNVVTPTPSPSVVTWTQVQATGTKIATISIDGVDTDVYAPTSSGASTFAGLSDVDLTSLADGQVAVYNSSTSKWENETLSLGDTVSYTDLQQSGTKIGTLTINGTGYDLYAPTGGGSASALNDLSDVTLSSPSNGQVLKYDGANSRWINANETGGGASDLDDLTDVDITSATTGQTLVYNSTTSKWENEDLVVANPSGSASTELEKIQIGNTIYSLPSGGSGGGFTQVSLYTATQEETTIQLSQSIADFDLIEFVGQTSDASNIYNASSIYNASELLSYIGTTNRVGVCNEASYSWYTVSDVDELTVAIAQFKIKQVYGYKLSGGSGSGGIDKLWEYSDSYDITLSHDFTDYDFLVFEGNNWRDTNHKGGSIVSSAELESIRGVSGKMYTFIGANGEFVNYTVVSKTSMTVVEGASRVTTVWGIKNGGGSTVVANPTGTPTTELESLQVGNDIYSIPTGGSGDASWKDITGTLATGQTEITLSDVAITQNSTVNVYTDTFGVNPTSVELVSGQQTSLQPFVTQESELDVTITVSSYLSESYEPWMAFTESGNAWVCEYGNSDYQWFGVEFDTNVKIIEIEWICSDSGRRGTITNLQYSSDGTTWNDSTLSTNERCHVVVSSTNVAKYWRMYFEGPFAGYQGPMIGHLQMYAETNGVKVTFPVQSNNLGVKVRVS